MVPSKVGLPSLMWIYPMQWHEAVVGYQYPHQIDEKDQGHGRIFLLPDKHKLALHDLLSLWYIFGPRNYRVPKVSRFRELKGGWYDSPNIRSVDGFGLSKHRPHTRLTDISPVLEYINQLVTSYFQLDRFRTTDQGSSSCKYPSEP
ncbi:uncharacterized protein PAC_10907 [Phialocephala subalpina]|uniref:Uncharacterized protein n=1 Tax=Phialocephala subalpina TaxID=576137 RepID=A0A1L7X7L5_9HELO|nr:uncharacterized protein PAC_10907 [Phialocephala subalpina]